MKVTDYFAIDVVDVYSLNRVVKQLIAKGMQPFGAVTHISNHGHDGMTNYIQIMVKYEETSEDSNDLA